MRKLFGLSLIATAAIISGMSMAEAAPAVPPGLSTPDGLVQQVRDGCGRGWFRNAWGRCVPFRYGRPYYGRPYYGRPYYGGPYYRPYYHRYYRAY